MGSSGPDGHLAPAAMRRAVPALLVGTTSIVAGGLVAAVTATAPSEHGAWLAAYLVLVSGVAQVALAAGQALLATGPPSSRVLAVELAAWNLGNLAVAAGTLAGLTLLVDVGGALLVLALALVVAAVRVPGEVRGAGASVDRLRQWVRAGFLLLVLVLLVSIPVGLWLARLDHG